MIKDIGIEGLKAEYVEPLNPLDSWAKGQAAFILPQGCKMELIDVTTYEDTERKYMQAFTGNQGTM